MIGMSSITTQAEQTTYNSNTDNVIVCSTETIIGYALQYNMDPNIPYILGGSRWSGDGTPNPSDSENYDPLGNRWIFEEMTLERLSAEEESGTDCTGFVSQAYQHFGYSIPAGSSIINQSAVAYIYDINEARPGDVVWWKDAHAGLYLGDGYILHTNGDPNNMYIHISKLYTETATPTCFLRLTNNIELLELNAYTNGQKVSAQYIYEHQADLLFDTGIKSSIKNNISNSRAQKKKIQKNQTKSQKHNKNKNNSYVHPLYLKSLDLYDYIRKFVDTQKEEFDSLSILEKKNVRIYSLSKYFKMLIRKGIVELTN